MEKYSSYRLMLTHSLQAGKSLPLNDDDAHYLTNVLRCKLGDIIRVFNTQEGEFVAKISTLSKKGVVIELLKHLTPPITLRPLTLGIGILKPDKFLDAIDMATQLGVTEIIPLLCKRSNMRNINSEKAEKRLQAATEQSERFAKPHLLAPMTLEELIKQYTDYQILFANETLSRRKNLGWPEKFESKIICLVGPEGGFDKEEIASLILAPNIVQISLGATILRAEVAAAAMLSYVQFVGNISSS